ncbi:spore germination protein [Desmospora activa]|uniref:Spore germination protein KA/spore germination protein n=1 Tax=Desmospora activa DSM 45169 TaxID=1121389 RepID=A0A2T4ZB59_9BACL|nr:spore germination protein [Desmospora activa]PTM59133.1 spore germination protein KA/spore germination protein [Desmospora activa DSM 45169]
MRKRRERKKREVLEKRSQEQVEKKVDNTPVFAEVEKNAKWLAKTLGDSSDVVTRRFTIQYTPDREAIILYLDGMCNTENIDEYILSPLMLQGERVRTKSNLWKMVEESLVHIGEISKESDLKKMLVGLLNGDAILFVDGYTDGLIINAKGWPQRGVGEPRAESVVRGSREAFTETLRVNTAMIRRRLKDPSLRLTDMKAGDRTNTSITILHLDGVADPDIVNQVKQRIDEINLDGILESGYIEEMIQDVVWSPFPTIQNTERPDAVVSHLLEGKVAIIVDGTPQVLIAPAIFSQFYYSPEDYYSGYLIGTFLRLLRLLSFVIALMLPALYIAFIAFHPEMIPTQLAIAMAAGRATVPFPSIVEALVMETSVEILREASIRLPGPIGPTIGIVGALVIGDAAVTAGLVSPLMVIVVGLTTISSYANPSYNAAISVRLLRFPLMIAASILGLYGIVASLMVLLLHLLKIRSFGIPYLVPFSPLRLSDLKDTLIRIPWPWMKSRPTMFKPEDNQRTQGGKPVEHESKK